MLQTAYIGIKVSLSRKKEIEEIAKTKGLGMSGYIKQLVYDDIDKKKIENQKHGVKNEL